MPTLQSMNPFAKREEHSSGSITTYKVLTIVTWLLSVIVSFYYCTNAPYDGHFHRKIWAVNYWHVTGFTMNSVIASIYWVVLFVTQIGYISALFSGASANVNAAASVGSHFIFNNLLHFAWVMLFVRGHFWLSELMLIINFFNLSSLYFRHNTYARHIHLPAVSGPLAWTFVAIYWNGAIMVHAEGLVSRIFANIFIWSILVYGMFFIIIYKDYTMGFNLSVLSAAIGVGQFLSKAIALQWIFAFVIMAVLFIMTLVVAVPAWTGKEFKWRRAPTGDAERAPLLNDN